MSFWLVAIFLLPLAPMAQSGDPMLFVYFKEPANMGVFFAVSDDGYHWQL